MDNTVNALKNLYVALGGQLSNVAELNKIPDMINAIANISDKSNVSLVAEDGSKTMFGTNVSDMQTNLVVGDNAIVGTLKKLTTGDLVTNYGQGYFMGLKFVSDWSKYNSVKVGLNPSQTTGLVEIINDPDKNGAFKVTNKATQTFKIVATLKDGTTKTQEFNLSDLTLED